MEKFRDPSTGQFKKGEKPHNFKGKYKTSDGYIDVYIPDHPFARARGYVFEHRLVMEKKLGRYLTSKEHVHHINEVRDDNRIENLQLCANNAEHQRKHLIKRNINITEKRCTLCKEVKSVKDFPFRLNSPKAKVRCRYYSSWCKHCSHIKRHPSRRQT